LRSRTAVPDAAPSNETFATSAASACTHAERPGTAATARFSKGVRGTVRVAREEARGRERRVRLKCESRESRRRAAREKRISTKLGAASRGASRATRDARRDPPETARRRATPPRALHDGRAGGFGAVPRRPGRSRSPAGRLGGVTKTLEMGFRSPRKGGGWRKSRMRVGNASAGGERAARRTALVPERDLAAGNGRLRGEREGGGDGRHASTHFRRKEWRASGVDVPFYPSFSTVTWYRHGLAFPRSPFVPALKLK
jgi:hypothetical protein